MLFSIVVVAYQRYAQIPCLIHSLLSQTFDDFEVIVLHDGPDEKHLSTMSPFLTDSRIKYGQTQLRYNDYGHSLRNLGIQQAKGDFIINTNDDNYYVPIWLDELQNVITKNPDCNFVYYDMILSHHNILNHNRKDYGLLIPKIEHSMIDVGQYAVKRDVIKNHKFKSNPDSDGDLIVSMKDELNPIYLDKVLFVHN